MNGRHEEGRARYHILYWENANFQGIQFTKGKCFRDEAGRMRTFQGPGECGVCGGIVDSYKHRLDNMQTSLRMCVDAQGFRFREDVEDFVCLSPQMSIKYHLGNFQRYITLHSPESNLTEETVISTIMKVQRGEIDPYDSGVSVDEFWQPEMSYGREWTGKVTAHLPWLREYVSEVRRAAEDSSGLSVGLMLDKNGIEVSSFGVSTPMFAHAPDPPIREVIILVGGPHGIDEARVLPGIIDVFNDTRGSGLHLGTTHLRLPGGLQHSYVALGDLLNCHDRGYLLPILEDIRKLGANDYKEWVSRMGRAFCKLADIHGPLETKREVLKGLISAFNSDAMRSNRGSQASRPSLSSSSRSGSGVKRPMDVENRLAELQAQGVLPTRRGWRAQMSLRSLEPERILEALDYFQEKAFQASWTGYPLEDPWEVMSDILDDHIQAGNREDSAEAHGGTMRDVEEAFLRVRGDEDSLTAARGTAQEVRYLRVLTCSQAHTMLDDLAASGFDFRRTIAGQVETRLQRLSEEACRTSSSDGRDYSQAPWHRSAEGRHVQRSQRDSRSRSREFWRGQRNKLVARQPSHPPLAKAMPKPPSQPPPARLVAPVKDEQEGWMESHIWKIWRVVCPAAHELEPCDEEQASIEVDCDKCKMPFKMGKMRSCLECDYHLCFQCAKAEAKGQPSSSEQHVTSNEKRVGEAETMQHGGVGRGEACGSESITPKARPQIRQKPIPYHQVPPVIESRSASAEDAQANVSSATSPAIVTSMTRRPPAEIDARTLCDPLGDLGAGDAQQILAQDSTQGQTLGDTLHETEKKEAASVPSTCAQVCDSTPTLASCELDKIGIAMVISDSEEDDLGVTKSGSSSATQGGNKSSTVIAELEAKNPPSTKLEIAVAQAPPPTTPPTASILPPSVQPTKPPPSIPPAKTPPMTATTPPPSVPLMIASTPPPSQPPMKQPPVNLSHANPAPLATHSQTPTKPFQVSPPRPPTSPKAKLVHPKRSLPQPLPKSMLPNDLATAAPKRPLPPRDSRPQEKADQAVRDTEQQKRPRTVPPTLIPKGGLRSATSAASAAVVHIAPPTQPDHWDDWDDSDTSAVKEPPVTAPQVPQAKRFLQPRPPPRKVVPRKLELSEYL